MALGNKPTRSQAPEIKKTPETPVEAPKRPTSLSAAVLSKESDGSFVKLAKWAKKTGRKPYSEYRLSQYQKTAKKAANKNVGIVLTLAAEAKHPQIKAMLLREAGSKPVKTPKLSKKETTQILEAKAKFPSKDVIATLAMYDPSFLLHQIEELKGKITEKQYSTVLRLAVESTARINPNLVVGSYEKFAQYAWANEALLVAAATKPALHAQISLKLIEIDSKDAFKTLVVLAEMNFKPTMRIARRNFKYESSKALYEVMASLRPGEILATLDSYSPAEQFEQMVEILHLEEVLRIVKENPDSMRLAAKNTQELIDLITKNHYQPKVKDIVEVVVDYEYQGSRRPKDRIWGQSDRKYVISKRWNKKNIEKVEEILAEAYKMLKTKPVQTRIDEIKPSNRERIVEIAEESVQEKIGHSPNMIYNVFKDLDNKDPEKRKVAVQKLEALSNRGNTSLIYAAFDIWENRGSSKEAGKMAAKAIRNHTNRGNTQRAETFFKRFKFQDEYSIFSNEELVQIGLSAAKEAPWKFARYVEHNKTRVMEIILADKRIQKLVARYEARKR